MYECLKSPIAFFASKYRFVSQVHRLYRDPSIGIDVAWVLTKIFLIEGYEVS